MLENPTVAALPCSECAKWMYDDNWKRQHSRQGPIPRPKGCPTPCWKCPKESPSKASQYELTDRNKRALNYYYQSRGCSGNVPMDDWTRQLFGVIEQIVPASEMQRAVELAVGPMLFGTAQVVKHGD